MFTISRRNFLLSASGSAQTTRRALSGFVPAALLRAAPDSLPLASAAAQLDDCLTRAADRYLSARVAALAAVRTPEQVRACQRHIRKCVIEGIGGLPSVKTPLNARITGVVERPGYRIEKVLFESLPRFYVTANVYVPQSGGPRFSALVGTAGHNDDGKAFANYQTAWASLAKRGILVLAFDPPGQGERTQHADVPMGTPQHWLLGTQCLLTGATIARYFVWDAIRAVDYLSSRADVDPARIGVAGNSGGGGQAALLAAVEPRFAAIASSCYMTAWDTIFRKPIPQDAEQYFLNYIRNGLDVADLAIAAAPRPFLILTATRDFFSIEGAKRAYEEVRRIYSILGVPERAGFFEYDDIHGYSQPRREATYRWMQRWLNAKDDPGTETAVQLASAAELAVIPNGIKDSETIQTENLAAAEKLHRKRTAVRLKTPEELRSLVRSVLNLGGSVKPVRVTGSDKLEIETEPGVILPALLLKPQNRNGKAPAMLCIDPSAADARAFLEKGTAVLAMNPRGWPAKPFSLKAKGVIPERMAGVRAMLLGTTVLAMQIHDILCARSWLASLADVDAGAIGIAARGTGSVLALYAATADPCFASAYLEPVASYMEIAASASPHAPMVIIVPGVLAQFDLPDLAKAIAGRIQSW